MKLYLAGEYIFPSKIDFGLFHNRLLSYDYQLKFVDKLQELKEKMNLYMDGGDTFGREEFKKYMDLYLATSEKEQFNKQDFDFNVLFNFLESQNTDYYHNNDMYRGKLFIDSGAFSSWTKGKKIDVDSYIQWLNDRPFIDLFGQVDVIPGDRVMGATLEEVEEAAGKTWENYLYMRERVIKKESLLYTFHVNEPIKYLKQALEWTDENGNHIPYIALGGMVGKPRAVRRAFLENCFNVIEKSSNPDVKVHAFGMTDFDLLEEFPIYSADSTSWIMVGAMGNIMTNFGNIAVSENQKNDKNHFSHLSKDVITEFNKMIGKYGFTLEELSISVDKRIMLNAMYMIEKASKINNRKKRIKKKKLF